MSGAGLAGADRERQGGVNRSGLEGLVLEVSQRNLGREMRKSKIPVLLLKTSRLKEFYPGMRQILDKLARQFAGEVKFLELDIDEGRSAERTKEDESKTPDNIGSLGIPLYSFFTSGKYLGDRVFGGFTEESLSEFIKIRQSLTPLITLFKSPVAKKLSKLKRSKIPDEKNIDNSSTGPFISSAMNFLSDARVSSEFPIVNGMELSFKHTLSIFHASRGMSTRRAKRLKQSSISYLSVVIINNEALGFASSFKQVFSKMLDHLDVFKASAYRDFYQGEIDKDLNKSRVALKDAEEAKYITPSHISFAKNVISRIDKALKSANQNTDNIEELNKDFIEVKKDLRRA